MNIQLAQVLTDIGGTTGFAIIRAIVAGEHDGVQLAQLRDPRCKSSEATIAKALSGNWKPEQLFVLQQSLELYDFYTQQLVTCDTHIEAQFAAMRPRWEPAIPLPPVPPTKPDSRSKNQPALATRAELIRLTGVDLVAIKGISTSLAQTILSEIGTDMERWPTDKHFASWLGLAPHNDISGGKVLRSRTLPTANRAGQAFRQAAASVIRSRTAFGAFYRRKCAQLGPRQALVATAHKIARTVYHLLKYHVPFEELGASGYELKQRQRKLAFLRKKAAQLGFTLSDTPQQATP
jgi:transposase